MFNIVKIKEGPFYFPLGAGRQADDRSIALTYDYLQEIAFESYLRCIMSKRVDNDFFTREVIVTPNNVKAVQLQMMTSIAKSCRKIRRALDLTNHPLVFRMEDDTHTAHISMRRFDNSEGDKPTVFMLSLILTNSETMIAEMYLIKIALGENGAYLDYSPRIAFYTGESYSIIKNQISIYGKEVTGGNVGPTISSKIEEMLKLAYDALSIPEDQWLQPVHQPAEMMLFRHIIETAGDKISVHSISSWGSINKDDSEFTGVEVPEILHPNVDHTSVPKIDFSVKEWKFIENYCIRNGILTHDGVIDLHKYVDKPRYGNIFKLPMVCEETDPADDKTHRVVRDLIAEFEIIDDSIVVSIADYCSDHTVVLVAYRFLHLEEFNPYTCVDEMERVVIYDNPKFMYSNSQNIRDISPLYGADAGQLAWIVEKVFKSLIIIQDRPERSKMVKCTETCSVKKRVSNSKKKKTVEKEIVWRVLKATKDAKEYIAQMSSDPNRRNAVYTLEHWEREGHLRTYKSGKMVWIQPTTCHRHMPLTTPDGEIHIKL